MVRSHPSQQRTKSSGEERAKLKGLTIRMQCLNSSQSDRIASGARAGVTGRGLGIGPSGLPLEARETGAFKSALDGRQRAGKWVHSPPPSRRLEGDKRRVTGHDDTRGSNACNSRQTHLGLSSARSEMVVWVRNHPESERRCVLDGGSIPPRSTRCTGSLPAARSPGVTGVHLMGLTWFRQRKEADAYDSKGEPP